MTSFGHKEAEVQGWNPSFRIQGQVFHHVGSLLLPEEGQPKFLQVYFLDSHAKELAARNHSGLKPHILEMLTKWFHQNDHLKTLVSHLVSSKLQEMYLQKEATLKSTRSSSERTNDHKESTHATTTPSLYQKSPS